VNVQSRLRVHLEPEFATRVLTQIRPGDIESFLARTASVRPARTSTRATAKAARVARPARARHPEGRGPVDDHDGQRDHRQEEAVWVAEPVKWPEQRARFQKVMDEAFGAEPAPIAKVLAHAIKLRDDIRAKRISTKRVAAARETTVEELREYLELAKLAPVVRDQVLRMTTVTANELVTEEKLRFVARERNHLEQRRMYERLLAGQLRCTRAQARLAAVALEQWHRTPAPTEPVQTPTPMEVPSIAASAVG
jgi:hypothetical protein